MMKKFCVFAILLCMSAAAFSPAAAFAAEVTGGYPDLLREKLTFDNLKDYAVNSDGSVLFADGNKLILWTQDEKTLPFNAKGEVTDVDCSDGNYFYATAEGAYVLPSSPENLPGEKTNHDFTKSIKRDFPVRDGFRYYFGGNDNDDTFDGSNVFHVVKTSDSTDQSFPDYIKVKPYGDKIYAVKDNVLYEITDGQAQPEEYYYSNYNLLTQVPVQNAAETLRLFSESPQKVIIQQGSRVTELNPDKIADGDYFYAGDELSARNKTHEDVSGSALLLAETDGTKVVSQGSKIYMLGKDDAVASGGLNVQQMNATANPNCNEYAYALPFVSRSTSVFGITPQDSLTVVGAVLKENDSCLAHDFYIVEKDGVRGYVPKEFLNDLAYPNFNEGSAGLTADPSPENGNNVRTVVLVLLVILLLLVAAGYLTYLFTSGKKSAKARKSGTADGDYGDGKINTDDML